MTVEVELINVRQFNRAMDKYPSILGAELIKAFRSIVTGYQRRWIRARLSGRKGTDVRDAKGNLVSWGVGLKRPTGGLARDLLPVPRVTGSPNDLSSIVARLGFFSPQGRKIAAVHELGTRKYGGTLPDITPKRGKVLVFPIRDASRAFGKVVTHVVTTRVGIPPRLEFIKLWNTPEEKNTRNKRINEAIARSLSRGRRGT